MRGTVSKRLRRLAQDTADLVRNKFTGAVKRHGWIECPQAWRGKGKCYQIVCLGIRRKYLDLKTAYKRGTKI